MTPAPPKPPGGAGNQAAPPKPPDDSSHAVIQAALAKCKRITVTQTSISVREGRRTDPISDPEAVSHIIGLLSSAKEDPRPRAWPIWGELSLLDADGKTVATIDISGGVEFCIAIAGSTDRHYMKTGGQLLSMTAKHSISSDVDRGGAE